MTRRKFNSDLLAATQQSVAHVSRVEKGDDDGTLVVTFEHGALARPLIIRLGTVSVDDYPDLGFFAYSDDDDIPAGISDLLVTLSDMTTNKCVIDVLRMISKRVDTALDTTQDEDVEMTDVEDDTDVEETGTDEYSSDDGFYGGTQQSRAIGQQSRLPHSGREINGRFIQDLQQAKSAGFKIAFLSDVTRHASECTFALSVPVSHLGLPDDTLEAWEIKSKEHMVLLCKYDSGYPSMDKFTSVSQNHPSTMTFAFGTCSTYKPSLSSALAAFNKNTRNSKTAEYGISNRNVLDQEAVFVQAQITSSVDNFVNSELALLLQNRLNNGVSWDNAKQMLQDRARAGHLRQSGSALAGMDHSHGGEELEPAVSIAARSQLNIDYVLRSPDATLHLSKDQLSLPLIAAQFALRYFVKSTQYCLVCHRKTEHGFSSVKPYVCSDPLCLFQYMALGLGPNIEHDIITRPQVVDLLVSFCAVGLAGNKIREWPTGLAIKAPLLPIVPGLQAPGLPLPVSKDHSPPASKSLSIRLKMSDGSFDLSSREEEPIAPGIMVVIIKSSPNPSGPYVEHMHHCRITAVHKIRNENGNIMGRTVEFECLSSVAATMSSVSPAMDCTGEAQLFFYEHDLDDLDQHYQREALMTLINTIPSISFLRNYLVSHTGSLLATCNELSKNALALLRWIVASNRSFIVSLGWDDLEKGKDTGKDTGKGKGKESCDQKHATEDSEKLDGFDPENWTQFRFAQGSPEQENRFKKELDQLPPTAYPTIFAWHGSKLFNWHSIIRSGLNYDEVQNGRAYGNGVYFAKQFQVSQGYSTYPEGLGWVHSELNICSAISLCEIINRTQDFVSKHPYYVVNNVDWIQCRYLLVQRRPQSAHSTHSSVSSAYKPTTLTKSLSSNSSSSNCIYVVQDSKQVPEGPNGKILRVPMAALPKWRQIKEKPGSPALQSTQASSSQMLDDNKLDDFGEIIRLQKTLAATEVSNEEESADTVIVKDDPTKLSFTPGTVNVDSLPKLPAPVWATDNGRKVLGKELKALQKLQAKTPPQQLGWYINFENVDNMFHWIVELHSFELSLPLAQDMKRNKVSSIILEVRFGQQFPVSPPFVRVIRPRFLPFSQRGGGHVTAGGAMCMELLTNSGWSPVSSLESVLLQVRMAMCSLDPYPARLEAASRGRSADYGIGEAIEAYRRSATTHGWDIPSDLNMMNFG